MTTTADGDLNVAVRRISTLLRFLRSDAILQAIPQSPSSASITFTANHPDLDPVLVRSCLADAGIQGFRWYWSMLRIDKDGDIADEFFDDISFACEV